MEELANTNSKQVAKKILILGLENSGKTSIVLSLMRNTNLVSYINLKPTINVDRINYGFSGINYTIFDFGGQEQYRNMHLQNLDKYLFGVNKIIYVIDVQDVEKYELALQYLEAIIKFIEKTEGPFEFLVFLHKFDPALENSKQFSGENIPPLIEKIRKIFPSNLDYKLYKTTIHTVFQKTLVT